MAMLRKLANLFVLFVSVTVFMYANVAKAQQIVTEGLVSYWDFDDIKGRTVKDIWGNNDGAFVGDPRIVDGKFGKALEFDGTDYVEMRNPSFIPTGESALTMEAWIKPSAPADQLAQAGVLGWDHGPGNINGAKRMICIRKENPQEVYFWGHNADLKGGNAVLWEANEWQHVVITVTKDALVTIYSNGKFGQSGKLDLVDLLDENSIVVGRRLHHGQTFNGAIDDARIYDRALGPDEVKQNFAATIGLAVDPTKNPASTWGEIKK
jgi:hypothetical protein